MNQTLLYFNYEGCYRHYTARIMNIRQAKKYGEVIVAKPILLLALIDGIDNHVFSHNMFQMNDWLEARYKLLMREYTRHSIFDGFSNINNPFWHLESDGFWHLHYPGVKLSKSNKKKKKWLKEHVSFASFDEDFWILLQNKVMRQKVREYIIEHKLTGTHDDWGLMAAEKLGLLAGILLAVA